MAVKVNWRDVTPNIAHNTAIVWPVLGPVGTASGSYRATPIRGYTGITRHMIQPRMSGDYHVHYDREQVYVFTEGRGKMIVGDETIDVEEGDYVYCPLDVQHGLINDSDDWVEHLIIRAAVD